MLNIIYMTFDDRIDHYDVFKVRKKNQLFHLQSICMFKLRFISQKNEVMPDS